MGETLKGGFALIVQNWGQSKPNFMTWLDADTGCKEICYKTNPTMLVSNIVLNTNE